MTTGAARPGREFRGPEEVLAFIDAIREQTRRTLDRYEEYTARIGGLTGEGYAAGGSVRAVVDEHGAVTTIDIDDAALRHGSRLATYVLEAIREAQAARALRLAELGTALGGSTADVVRAAIPEDVRDAIDRRRGRGDRDGRR